MRSEKEIRDTIELLRARVRQTQESAPNLMSVEAFAQYKATIEANVAAISYLLWVLEESGK